MISSELKLCLPCFVKCPDCRPLLVGQCLILIPFVTAQVCVGIIIVLIIHNYWFLYIPYLTWLYFDWQTPEQGGRRIEWVRSWKVWKYFRDYFPIHVSKIVFVLLSIGGKEWVFVFNTLSRSVGASQFGFCYSNRVSEAG